MTRRKDRLADDPRQTVAPPGGPEVFPPSKDTKAQVSIPAISLSGERVHLRCRFPSATAQPQQGTPEREVIRMADKPKVSVTVEDPYLRSDQRVVERKAQRESAA